MNKIIKIDLKYFNPNSNQDPKGEFGSFLVDPDNPDLWCISVWGGLDREFAREMISTLRGIKENPPYKLEDFTSEEFILDISDYYSYSEGEPGGELELKAGMIDLDKIKSEKYWIANIPKDMRIEGILDFKILTLYKDQIN